MSKYYKYRKPNGEFLIIDLDLFGFFYISEEKYIHCVYKANFTEVEKIRGDIISSVKLEIDCLTKDKATQTLEEIYAKLDCGDAKEENIKLREKIVELEYKSPTQYETAAKSFEGFAKSN